MKPKYTIIIPTFERANLLKATLDGCLLQEYDNFEILVSNNFSRDGTESVLSMYTKNPKVRIVKTEKKLSMQDHWAFAMSHAEGDYILFLGDDDGVSKKLFKMIDPIVAAGIKIVKFKTALYYHNDWFGVQRNTLHFDSKLTGKYYDVDISRVIKNFCDFSDYRFFPSLLTCVFKRDLFMQASKNVRHMFVGAPDHSCIFLLLAQKNASLGYLDRLLGYGGRSNNSNSAFYSAQQKKSANKNKRHVEWSNEMSDHTRLPFHLPSINTPGNYLPAAFSYAKHYFPVELSDFQLNKFELCKVIQSDLVNCYIGRRPGWHSVEELSDFERYMDNSLTKVERQNINQLGSKNTFSGRMKLFEKRFYIFICKVLYITNIFNIELYREQLASKMSYDSLVNLDLIGINDSYALMDNFHSIIPKYSNKSLISDDLKINEALKC